MDQAGLKGPALTIERVVPEGAFGKGLGIEATAYPPMSAVPRRQPLLYPYSSAVHSAFNWPSSSLMAFTMRV